MTAQFIPVDPFDLVVFGGTGDLAMRKLLPGLYNRDTDGQLTPESRVIGAARSDLGDSVDQRLHVVPAIADDVFTHRQHAGDEIWPTSFVRYSTRPYHRVRSAP